MLKKIKRAFSDSNPRKIELNGDDILKGLHKLSKEIGKNNPERLSNNDPIIIVAAGGATSVLVLGNRLTTKDVDFFHMDYGIIQEVSAATDDLVHGSLKDFPPGWLNSEMLAFIVNNEGCENLYANSIQQGLVLFHSPTLVVYAVDWKFQLVNKITRAWQAYMMANMNVAAGSQSVPIDFQEKNLLDAVYILDYLVHQRQGSPLRLSQMKTWYFYGPALEIWEVDLINQAYCQLMKRDNPNFLPISTTT